MQVILLEKIRKLGGIGEQVEITRGYGRNYLLPQGKAVLATVANIETCKARQAELEQRAHELLAQAEKRSADLAALVVVVHARASEEGKLFGSVGTREIAEAVTKAGVALEKSEVLLPAGALRVVGQHNVQLQLHGDISVTISINTVPEAA